LAKKSQRPRAPRGRDQVPGRRALLLEGAVLEGALRVKKWWSQPAKLLAKAHRKKKWLNHSTKPQAVDFILCVCDRPLLYNIARVLKNNASVARIYIRLKHDNSIFLLECGSHENKDGIKKRLAPFFNNIETNKILLYIGIWVDCWLRKLLDDKSNIHDEDVSNDSRIQFKLRKPSNPKEYRI